MSFPPPHFWNFRSTFFKWVLLQVFNTENILILELVMDPAHPTHQCSVIIVNKNIYNYHSLQIVPKTLVSFQKIYFNHYRYHTLVVQLKETGKFSTGNLAAEKQRTPARQVGVFSF